MSLSYDSPPTESVNDFKERIEAAFEHMKQEKIIEIEQNIIDELEQEYSAKSKQAIQEIEQQYQKKFIEDITPILSQNPSSNAATVYRQILEALGNHKQRKLDIFEERITQLQDLLKQKKDDHDDELAQFFSQIEETLESIDNYQKELSQKVIQTISSQKRQLLQQIQSLKNEKETLEIENIQLSEEIEKKTLELQQAKINFSNAQSHSRSVHSQYLNTMRDINNFVIGISHHIESEVSVISKLRKYEWKSHFKASNISKTQPEEIDLLLKNIEAQYNHLSFPH